MKRKTFEQFLMDLCPGERHTNNSPEGFERWLEEQDVNNIMDYAEGYGKICFLDGKLDANEEIMKILPLSVKE